MRLRGKTALVTGATSGIGRATAQRLAGEGARVVVSGRDKVRGDEVVKAIVEAGGQAHFIAADLADARSAGELAVEATRILDGRIDILVNNAGIGIGGPTDAMTEADFDRIYAVNVKAPYFLTAAIAPAMAGRGEGVIVNLGSKTALLGTSASSLYGSSKAALELLTRCWAAEFGPRGVRVNTVSPGPTLTAMTAANPKNVELQVAHAPARRAGHPTEIAAAVAFLASDDAKYIHGARIPLDGGRTAV
ncbi:MAG TPA: SDR family oxidoreductase [Pseudonocardia sp.]|uniref:SDR family NAD(P)-dependent oxidoreductase n=1 Tax=Pseudonocardia sp. TaxID=60912 RepID=UPI002BCD98D8|nr:SDR family oxidoreductase [Pseudonocardia sp.]HTF54406.1 SDR family oxidoreductase [Pseudonocardia sp.]